jgi:hypothetical protein
VTDPEVENLLRETFADRPVPAAAVELSPAVRRKSARRRRLTWGAAGVGTLAVLVGAIFTAGALRGPAPVTLDPPAATRAVDRSVTPGWRLESSNGAEIEVPQAWTVNEWGCNQMTPNPTVVRGQGGQFMCLSDEPATKEVAMLSALAPADGPQVTDPSPLPSKQIEVDGVAAIRTEGTLSDGRYAGSIAVPSRSVLVMVRTKHEDVTKHILDSFRLVDVDHLGCASTARWPRTLPPAEPGKPLLPEHPAKVSLCLYLGEQRLQSSTELTGDTAAAIAAAVGEAEEGRNPDPAPSVCLPQPRVAPDMILIADGVTISVAFSGCTDRGVTDGRHWSMVSMALVRTLMMPTHAGWGISGDIK